MRGMKEQSVRDKCLQEQDRKRNVVPRSRLQGVKPHMKEVLGGHERGIDVGEANVDHSETCKNNLFVSWVSV